MHCFVRQVQKERFVGILLLLKKFDRLLRQKRRDVTVLRHSLAIVIDRVLWARRIVLPLPLETEPVIEARARIIAGVSHMPFADETRFVPRLLQILRKEERAFWNGPLIVDHAMAKGVQAGQDRSATGRTKRGGHERILQVRTLLCHRIHVRRLGQ